MLLSSSTNEQRLHPLLESVAERIRFHRKSLKCLSTLELDPELRSIYGKFDGDDLLIINELHSAQGFRKLHLELASLGSALQILHCVFFPEPTYDLPIFGVDLVAGPEGISAAIVDLSPVSVELPISIKTELNKISFPPFKNVRELPSWGTIFSPYVKFIRPADISEENNFLELVEKYLITLISHTDNLQPELSTSISTIERFNGQRNYCEQQKRNDKTRSVLAKTFNSNWADRYINVVLFDSPDVV